MAAISALEALKKALHGSIFTPTASMCVRASPAGFMAGRKNGWRTADKKPVKNGGVMAAPRRRAKSHQVRWHWVKGHAGHDANERADQLARDGVAMARLKEVIATRHHPPTGLAPASPMTAPAGDPVFQRRWCGDRSIGCGVLDRPVIGERKRRCPSDGYAGRRHCGCGGCLQAVQTRHSGMCR